MLRFVQALAPEARHSRLLGASVLLGVLVGVVVSAFEYVTVTGVLENITHQGLIVQTLAPLVGLALTAIILAKLGNNATNSTSDEYISAYHMRHPTLPVAKLPARLLAGVTTIGFGGALGLEGPSIYTGSVFGLQIAKRLDRWLGRGSAKLLLTAGAAAGVAAVFQAPATGVLFALEAPYRDDLAHRALLPSLLASASAYLTFISMPLAHPEPLLRQVVGRPLEAGDLIAALAIGISAGLGGRMYATLVRRTKKLAKETSAPVRVVVGGSLLSLLALLSVQLFDEPLTLGPGVSVVEWLVEDRTLQAVAIIFVLRIAATMTTILGGGTGGLFIPLAVQGVLLGELVGLGLAELGMSPNGVALLPVLGLAAFLAAGYRTPIAAVMFVAESTANSGSAVVPALIAAAVSQLVAGPDSVSAGQRVERMGHLEERLTMPLAAALTTDVLTVPPDATVSEFVWIHALGRRERVVPVVDGNTYLGLCSVEGCAQIERSKWETTTVADVLESTDITANPGWSLRDVVTAMEANRSTVIAVTDGERNFIGVVLESEIVKLGEIIDETGGVGL